MKQSLDLLENAADSLNEALRKVRDADHTNLRPYKFAVLHFIHAIELLFKHHVALSHPLLIYRNPFSKNLDKEATIGLWDAIQFFKNEQRQLTEEMVKDLKWIKDLRNKIEHHKFEMDVPEARRAMGRVIRALNEFHNAHGFTDLEGLIEQDCQPTFDKLADEYKQELFEAQQAAASRPSDYPPGGCVFCGEPKVVAHLGDKLECCFCQEVTGIEECTRCGNRFPDVMMREWNDDRGPDDVDWMCDYCYEHIFEDP